MIKEIKKFFYRQKLLRNSFFDNVICDCEKTMDLILGWMFNLSSSKGISVTEFSALFIKYDDIAFPIKISTISNLSLEIIDNKSEHYIFFIDSLLHPVYTIEKRVYPSGKVYKFQITKQSDILLVKVSIMWLSSNNTYERKNTLSFVYDYNKDITIAGIKHMYHKKPYLEIIYPFQDKEFDDKILELLFNIISSETDFNDVIDIFLNIYSIREFQNLSIKSRNDNLKLLSSITLKCGIVAEYSFTEEISASEICLHRNTISKDVRKFINEYSC